MVCLDLTSPMPAAHPPQVYLNVFEYFMFWNAFFVLRGGGSSGRAQSGGWQWVGGGWEGKILEGRVVCCLTMRGAQWLAGYHVWGMSCTHVQPPTTLDAS